MAYDGIFLVEAGQWQTPAAEDVAGVVKIQNVGGYDVAIYATTGAAPAGGPETVGHTLLSPGQGIHGTLSEHFTGSRTRLWVWSDAGTRVSVVYE